MGIFKLCPDEPIMQTIRDLFGANPVRIPEERMQPLCLLGEESGRISFIGGIRSVVTKPVDFKALLQDSRVADVSGKSSRKVNLDLGLSVMEGFLKGFGITTGGIGEIKTAFTGAREVSFSFGNVVRRYIEPVQLGAALTDVQIIVTNPVIHPFIGSDYKQLLIVDSVIISNDFSIKVERSGSQEFKLDVPALQQILTKASVNVKLEQASTLDVTFKGEKQLAFAFSCLSISVNHSGKVIGIENDQADRSFGLEGTTPTTVILPPNKTILTEPGELLELE